MPDALSFMEDDCVHRTQGPRLRRHAVKTFHDTLLARMRDVHTREARSLRIEENILQSCRTSRNVIQIQQFIAELQIVVLRLRHMHSGTTRSLDTGSDQSNADRLAHELNPTAT